MYGHIKAIAETAQVFASDATVVLGNASSTETIREFSAREYGASAEPGRQTGFGTAVTGPRYGPGPFYSTSAASVLGQPLPEEKRVQILNWIPPRVPDEFSESSKSDSRDGLSGAPQRRPFDDGDVSLLSSAMDDLDVELHGKRIAKGISLLENGKFEDASNFFARALRRMEKRSATPEVEPFIKDVKLLLAQAYVGQKKEDEAVKVLTPLAEATDGATADAVTLSAKHALADLALRRGDVEDAESLCLDAAKGRRKLFGTTSSASYASIKLLVEIYRELEEPDEMELWLSLLPVTELPRHERFIRCNIEIGKLNSSGQSDEAASMGIHFLKENYKMEPYWAWSDQDYALRWAQIDGNIRRSGTKGFGGWSSGMCTLHFLTMASPAADKEIGYLLMNGADPNATFTLPQGGDKQREWSDCTALMTAAVRGSDKTVSLLLEFGADPSRQESIGGTAAAFAASGGHLQLMQKLATHGLEPNMPVVYPESALRYSLSFDQTHVAQWLLENSCKTFYRDEQQATAMHLVARGNAMQCMDMLISRGENVSEKDMYGREPIHFAALYGRPVSIKRLLEKGANMEPKDFNQETPLLLAASVGNTSCGSFLIKSGADVKAQSVDRQTVLDRATG